MKPMNQRNAEANLIPPARSMRPRRLLRIPAVALVALSFAAPAASARIVEAGVAAKGMACPFCAYGVQKRLGNVTDVKDVTVDLKTNTARLDLAEGAFLDPEALARAVREAGFDPGEITLTAVGKLVEARERLALALPAEGQKFLLFENARDEVARHEGEQTEWLTPETDRALRKLREEGAAVRITGAVHAHEQGLAALRIDDYAKASK